MSVRWTVGLLVCAAPCVAGVPVAAQDATVAPVSAAVLAPAVPAATRHGKVRAVYDSTADSTRWSLATHKGRYRLGAWPPQ